MCWPPLMASADWMPWAPQHLLPLVTKQNVLRICQFSPRVGGDRVTSPLTESHDFNRCFFKSHVMSYSLGLQLFSSYLSRTLVSHVVATGHLYSFKLIIVNYSHMKQLVIVYHLLPDISFITTSSVGHRYSRANILSRRSHIREESKDSWGATNLPLAVCQAQITQST